MIGCLGLSYKCETCHWRVSSRLFIPRGCNGAIEYSETPFSAFLEPRKQSPRQCWRSLKFCLKSKLLNENGQLVGGGGGRMATTEFSLAYHCEFL